MGTFPFSLIDVGVSIFCQFITHVCAQQGRDMIVWLTFKTYL